MLQETHGQGIIKNSLSLSLVLRREKIYGSETRRSSGRDRSGGIPVRGRKNELRASQDRGECNSYIAGGPIGSYRRCLYLLLKIRLHQHARQPAVDDVVGLARDSVLSFEAPSFNTPRVDLKANILFEGKI